MSFLSNGYCGMCLELKIVYIYSELRCEGLYLGIILMGKPQKVFDDEN